ncbi:MAG: hypothetical protein V3U80_08370 [Flavobacteriaceae bacterium]
MKKTAIIILLLLLSFTSFSQTVHTVDNRPQSGAMFTTLSAAITAATSGDIIHIHPSATSYGNVIVDKTLSFIGLGHDPITHTQGLVASVNQLSFRENSANSLVTGLNVGNIATGGANSNRDDIHIIHNKVGAISGNGDNWIIDGNYITSTSTASINSSATGWVIKNNFMLGGVSNLAVTTIVTNNIFLSTTSGASQFVINNCVFTQISNNIFIATNSNMVEFRINNSPNISMRNNLTYNFAGGTVIDLPEDDPLNPTNLNNTNPTFVSVPLGSEDDFYNNDYHLTTAIPGTDGTNIGIHGLNFAFDHQGRPDLQPYPIDVIINNNIIAPGQNLSVRFTAAQKP